VACELAGNTGVMVEVVDTLTQGQAKVVVADLWGLEIVAQPRGRKNNYWQCWHA
jgi:hypothetical protein